MEQCHSYISSEPVAYLPCHDPSSFTESMYRMMAWSDAEESKVSVACVLWILRIIFGILLLKELLGLICGVLTMAHMDLPISQTKWIQKTRLKDSR